MNEMMTKYLQMGTVHFMSFPDVLADESLVLPTIKSLIADPYFSVLEVGRIRDERIRKDVADLFRRTDCRLIYAAQPEQLGPKLSMNTVNKEERKRVVQLLKDRIDEAYDMGAEGFGFISGQVEPGHEEAQEELLIESCRELCAHAKSRGDLFLELEPFDCDVHNKLLCGPSRLTRRVYDEVSRDFDNFGVLVDLSHLPLLRESAKVCLQHLGDAVTHVHIGNAVYECDPSLPLFGDFHPRFSMPGSTVGVPEISEFIKQLFEINFLGEGRRPIVSFEVKAWPPDDPYAVLAECKRTMDLAWALV